MALYKNRDASFLSIEGAGDIQPRVRILIAESGDIETVNLNEVQFTDEEKKMFDTQNNFPVSLIKDDKEAKAQVKENQDARKAQADEAAKESK